MTVRRGSCSTTNTTPPAAVAEAAVVAVAWITERGHNAAQPADDGLLRTSGHYFEPVCLGRLEPVRCWLR